MATGRTSDGRKISLSSVFEGVGAYQAGKIGESDLQELEQFGARRADLVRACLRQTP